MGLFSFWFPLLLRSRTFVGLFCSFVPFLCMHIDFWEGLVSHNMIFLRIFYLFFFYISVSICFLLTNHLYVLLEYGNVLICQIASKQTIHTRFTPSLNLDPFQILPQ